jgi:hypothetical protein
MRQTGGGDMFVVREAELRKLNEMHASGKH